MGYMKKAVVLVTRCGCKRYEPDWPADSFRFDICIPLPYRPGPKGWADGQIVVSPPETRTFRFTGKYELGEPKKDEERAAFAVYAEE